ncbi:putative cobalamin-independent homocysteine transmethylase [Candidatus Zinderia insecticola CARI]|uniref:5-methyltetrahydropteroyltriglutamate--homocysteine S-methyltransferase n=1 Tax=Zinderia insecticola (strain CARI) TaxID=871271 RepID=E0TJ55_ZINIC|nr:putative cobalamin-independent homocysteine transmethylase [Candidatus Zinderia insecticola CARI]
MSISHIIGMPRIGENREIKFAIESFWNKKYNENDLKYIFNKICLKNWNLQSYYNISYITVGDFCLYDHVLNMLTILGAIPTRFNFNTKNINYKKYFQMARGNKNNKPMEMTKWFNTNYHYLVPEWTKNIKFKNGKYNWLLNNIRKAKSIYKNIKVTIIGPLTLLYLGKKKGNLKNKLFLLKKIINGYKILLLKIKKEGINIIQIEEPILTLKLKKEWLIAFKKVYKEFKKININILLVTYFEELKNYNLIKKLPIYGIHIDIINNNFKNIGKFLNIWSNKKIISIGIINGRNIWKTNIIKKILKLKKLSIKYKNNLWISSSCSFLHIPLNLKNEFLIDNEIKKWLSFAKQKIKEIKYISDFLKNNIKLSNKYIYKNLISINNKKKSFKNKNKLVEKEFKIIKKKKYNRFSSFKNRKKKQFKKYNLPIFPTTLIGSFPQTKEIRNLRFLFKNKKINYLNYLNKIRNEIKLNINLQEKLNLDVLVHGEPERNDMVEYFGEQLWGFEFTSNGWVQSYGTRCVKPPIIYGDIYRPNSITKNISKFSQSLTLKPVKGMLTGPITMIKWSFTRNDQKIKYTAIQMSIALKKEVYDLKKNGIKIIQIDEPAFKEGLPIKKRERKKYLKIAVKCFKISCGNIEDEIQIHTHMCYSKFNNILKYISKMNADVITIETSRSNMNILNNFKKFKYSNDIGPGIYDIHSPKIPNIIDIVKLIKKTYKVINYKKIWINPDCGLKTRNWKETIESLKNMVIACKIIRKNLLK